jgi:hypothetical protein
MVEAMKRQVEEENHNQTDTDKDLSESPSKADHLLARIEALQAEVQQAHEL